MVWYIWLMIALICLGALIFLLTPVGAWIKKKWNNRGETYCKHDRYIDGTRDFRWKRCKKKCKYKK